MKHPSRSKPNIRFPKTHVAAFLATTCLLLLLFSLLASTPARAGRSSSLGRASVDARLVSAPHQGDRSDNHDPGRSSSLEQQRLPAMAAGDAGPLVEIEHAEFIDRRYFGTGWDSTRSVAVGDVNGDGALDLIVGNKDEENAVYLNDGFGNFRWDGSARSFGASEYKTASVAVGDLNGDGALDIAVGNSRNQNIVYLNDGAGNFGWDGSIRDFGARENTASVAVGDMDGDGDLDIVVGNDGDTQNAVYLNDGLSGFYTDPLDCDDPSTLDDFRCFGSEDDTKSVVIGDVNSDGALDLVVGNDRDQNVVYLNDGAGNFDWPGSARKFGTGQDDTTSVAVGDMDGDRDLDIALGNYGSEDNNMICLNDGEGYFDECREYGPGIDETYSVAVGDVDGDGALDIVVGNGEVALDDRDPSVIYLNDGAGGFAIIADPVNCDALPVEARCFGADTDDTRSVVLADVDSDGALDLIAGNKGHWNVAYLNDGFGRLSVGSSRPFGADTSDTKAVAVGDVNGDGALDLVVGNWEKQNLLYVNSGNGNFYSGSADGMDCESLPENAHCIGVGSDKTESIAIADLNSDGALDIIVGNEEEPNLIYLNSGADDFDWLQLGYDFGTGEDDTKEIATGDMDGDGDLDIVVANDDDDEAPNMVYLNDGRGGFYAGPVDCNSPPGNVRCFGASSDNAHSVAIGDVNNDNILDIVMGSDGRPNRVCLNDGIGHFDCQAFGTGSDATHSLAVGDLNGDGALDVAVANWEEKANAVYLNDGKGNFGWSGAGRNFGTGSDGTWSVGVWDVNGDGALDIVAGNKGPLSGQQNVVYLNDGAGNFDWFNAGHDFGAGSDKTQSVAAGDLNGDGALDLVIGNEGQNRIYLSRARLPQRLANTPPHLAVTRPGLTANADLYSTPEILDSRFIPITYTLFDLEGDPVEYIAAAYSLDGGGTWLTAVSTNTQTTNLGTRRSERYASSNEFPIPIPDQGAVSSTLVIPDSAVIADLDVWLNITHTYDKDLNVYLESPGGVRVELFTHVGGSGDHFLNTLLDDGAATSITSGAAPFTGRFRPEGSLARFNGETAQGAWTLSVRDDYQNDTGSILSWGVNLQRAGEGVHTFVWDTFASGLFGQSDNVIFGLKAYPNLHPFTNTVAGPYQWPHATAATFPFRVRGAQVRVMDENSLPVSNALVYRLPAGHASDGQPMRGGAAPFRTSPQGYLSGRGQLDIGDRLIALAPIATTDAYTLYHTSAAPNQTGLDLFTVSRAGVQTLTVSADNPLLIFDLDVSLQWDASNDSDFLTRLKHDLLMASESLYDWTNGQVAVGQMAVHQAKERWQEADIHIAASNLVRPSANRGGIVTATTVLTHPALTEPITATDGLIRIGPAWNRYGDAVSIGQDWPRVLAHELGHYLLFLEDTYLGLDEDSGLLVPIDTCDGTAMTDPYEDVSSEFRYDDGAWQQDCGDTLAELPDWDLIALAYPALHTPPPENTGPTNMPFAFTQVEIRGAPTSSPPLLDDDKINLGAYGDSLAGGRAYLIRRHEQLTDLGRPIVNSLQARGAREGDELCVFGVEDFVCTRLSNSGPPQLSLRPAWQPEIMLTPVNTATLQVLVATGDTSPLTVTLYPNNGTPQTATLTASVVQTITLQQPAVEVLVDITGDEASERLITGYTAGSGPGRARSFDGPGRARSFDGPVTSSDGRAILLPPQNISDTVVMILQTATTLPDPPPGVTPLGRAYYVRSSTVMTDFVGGSIVLQYVGLDVLLMGAPEENLAVYYKADGEEWRRLNTVLNTVQNMASAPLSGPGLYVLMAGFEIPLYGPGWNNVPYLAPDTRPISEALASIAGYYTCVDYYDPTATDLQYLWKVYCVDVEAYVNDLQVMEYAKAYWIYVTENITWTLRPASGAGALAQSTEPFAADSIPLPPATYYGPVLAGPDFTPMADMTVTAWIGDALCGQGRTLEFGQQVVYSINVFVAGAGPGAGCGAPGDSVVFQVGAHRMANIASWSSDQAWEAPLNPGLLRRLYVPLVIQ